MPEPVIICLHQPALELAEKVASLCDGEVHGLQSRVKTIPETFEKTKEHLRDLFQKGHPLVGICSSGILIRSLADVLSDKHTDCLLYTSPSPRDVEESRMPSSA